MTLDVDEIIEEPKRLKKDVALSPAKTLNDLIWKSYSVAYEARYKTPPIRNAQTNSKIAQLSKRLGADAPSVVEFFLKHNDGFYIKSLHAIGLCLRDAEALHTQWVRGISITGTKVREFERKEKSNETIDWINSGGLGEKNESR